MNSWSNLWNSFIIRHINQFKGIGILSNIYDGVACEILNAPLVLYGIVIIRIFFVGRMGAYNVTIRTLSKMIFKESKLFKIASFQNFGRLLQLSSEIQKLLLLPFLISFKMYVYVINCAKSFRHSLMKNYLIILKSKTVECKFLLSREINLKK